MTTAIPKARARRADDLSLYAHAQARARDVLHACEQACKGCPGPGEEGGCETRTPPKLVAGRADWPICPMGLLKVQAWRDIVDLKIASRISPLAGFPDNLSAFAFRGLLELETEVRREDERQAAESRKTSERPAGGGLKMTFKGRKKGG